MVSRPVGLSTAILIHVFDFYLQSVYEYLEMQGKSVPEKYFLEVG